MKYPVRGKKELKRLAKRLAILLNKGFDRSNAHVQLLITQIKWSLQNFRFNRRFVRRALGTGLIAFCLGTTQTAQAQASFIPPVNIPYGLTATYATAAPAAADMDNDGDLDLLVAEYYGSFQYFENTGTATAPAFAAPVSNPFGLTAGNVYLPEVTIGDLDGDGDFDVMTVQTDTNNNNVDIKYFENTGTATAPAFAAPTINPFGLTPGYYFQAPQLVDIDNDGDLDFFSVAYDGTSYLTEIRYQENTGTALAPAFGTTQVNPLGLSFPSSSNYIGYLSFADLDNDGDLDLLFGDGYSNGNFEYMENIGTATVPNFTALVTNPFNLVSASAASMGQKVNNPALLDLDGDGDFDIISGEYGGNLIYFQNIDINSGPLAILSSVTSSPSCSPGGDGGINVLAAGGTAPITYRIGTDSNTTGAFINYSPGTYTVRVRDSLNTIIDSVVTISAAIPPIIDSNGSLTQNVSCNGAADGVLLVTANGGTAPLTFDINPGGSNTTGFFNPLAAGTYSLIVTDAKNCVDSSQFTITQPLPLTLATDSIVNLSCFGVPNGEAYTTTAGGNGGFTYTLTPNLGVQSFPGDYTNLPAGNYTLQVTDNNSCNTSIQLAITEPPALVLSITSSQNATSATAADGSIVGNASGGTPGYSYSLTPNAGVQNPAGTFMNLPAGNYTLNAIDANNCSQTQTVRIEADWAVGINDIEKHNIKLYPNPVSDVLKLESDVEIQSLSVLDITGKLIKQIKNPEETVSLNTLPSGLYVLKLNLINEETVYTRITKQ
jgi:hypothetical protein